MKALDTFAALPQDRKEEIEKRFWSKIRKGGDSECWEWTAAKNARGYGSLGFRLEGELRTFLSHRVAWVLNGRDIPHGLLVCHTCDNPPCCNPAHLFVGTSMDNARDRDNKGRGGAARGDANGSRLHPETRQRGEAHWSRLAPEKLARGESNGFAKLKDTEVLEIRCRYAMGDTTLKKLGEEFGVNFRTIWTIIRNEQWKHLPQ